MQFDLLVEFYEDAFEDDPALALEAMRGDDGEIVIDDSGDELIDKWERELSQGLVPDLEEGLSEAEKKKLEKERSKVGKAKRAIGHALVDEDFGKVAEEVAKQQKLYESKSVPIGSFEERALSRAATLRKRSSQLPTILGEGLNRRGR